MTIQTEQESDGRWIAEVTELTGAIAYGETPEVAVRRVQALALRVIADRLEQTEAVPPGAKSLFASVAVTTQCADQALSRLESQLRDIGIRETDQRCALCRKWLDAIETGDRALVDGMDAAELLGLRSQIRTALADELLVGARTPSELPHIWRELEMALDDARRSGSADAMYGALRCQSGVASFEGDTHRAIELIQRAAHFIDERKLNRVDSAIWNLASLWGQHEETVQLSAAMYDWLAQTSPFYLNQRAMGYGVYAKHGYTDDVHETAYSAKPTTCEEFGECVAARHGLGHLKRAQAMAAKGLALAQANQNMLWITRFERYLANRRPEAGTGTAA